MTAKKQNPKAANGNGSGKPIIRIAVLKNPATGREVLERVTADGRLSARAATKLGTKSVKAWREVEAASWREATKKIKAGAGKKVSG